MHARGVNGRRATNAECSRLQPGLAQVKPRQLIFQRPSRRQRQVVCMAGKRSHYDVLGVPQTASERDIKSAYRKRALKLHPDVNKAPDAQQRFMEAKMAFEVLSNPQQRAEYDRRLRMGFDTSDWGSTSSSSSGFGGGYGSYKRPSSQPVDNYSFEDFMRDLDKEINDWAKSKPGGVSPTSLAEELAALGEEFVDFLEDAIGVKGSSSSTTSSSSNNTSSGSSSSSTSNQRASSSSSTSSSSSSRSAADEFDELWKRYIDPLGKDDTSSSYNKGSSSSTYSSSSSSQSRAANTGPKKSADDDIDAMLAELKRKARKS